MSLADQFAADAQSAGGQPPAPTLSLADQFAADAKIGAAAPKAAPIPQNGVVSDFSQSFLHNAIKPFHAAAQFVENAAAKGASMLPDNPVSRAIVNTANQDNLAQQQWEKQYQQSVPDNAASYTGAVAGSVAPMLFGGISRGLQAAGDAIPNAVSSVVNRFAPRLAAATPSVLPKIVSGTTQGVIGGSLMTPVDNGKPYWEQKGQQATVGGLFGATVPVVGAVASGVKNAAAPILNPKSVVQQGLQKWGVTPESLANAPEYVPGSLPTTAQVVGNPQIVAAEKALANNPAYKPQFDARNIANNDARLGVVQGIAQTPQAVEAAVAARKAATAPLQDSLLTNGAPVPVNSVLEQLDSLAKSPLGQRPAIGSAANDISSQIRQFATPDAQGNLTIPPAHLDVIRQNVKDFLAKYAPNGAVGTQQQAAFEPVRSAIVDAIEGANPGYRNYLAQYARLSAPINTMEAGQSIMDNLGNRAANASGAPQLTLTGVNSQVKQALSKPYGISPDAQQALEGLQADLQRASISNSVRAPGSDTAYNLQAPGWMGKALYGSQFQGGKALPILGSLLGGTIGMHTGGLFGLATGAGSGAMAGKKLADFASQRVNNVLAEALLNPDIARQIIATQPKSSPVVQGLLARLPQAGLMMSNRAVNSQSVPSLLATH